MRICQRSGRRSTTMGDNIHRTIAGAVERELYRRITRA